MFIGAPDHTKRFSRLAKQTTFVSGHLRSDFVLTWDKGGVIDSNEEEIVKKLEFSIKMLAGKQSTWRKSLWTNISPS